MAGSVPEIQPEFELIGRCFTGLGATHTDVLLGVGDDAALVRGQGPLNTGVALLEGEALDDREHVAGLVSAALSEACAGEHAGGGRLAGGACLAGGGCLAGGAFATLSLSTPDPADPRIARFAALLDTALRANDIALVGGDTTSGHLLARLFVTRFNPVP